MNTQGRRLLATPSRAYLKSSPPALISASAGSHLAPQSAPNPGLWLGFAHHLLVWGVCSPSMPCFYTSHPSFWGSQGGSQPGPPRPPPVQARPRSGAAPWRHGPGPGRQLAHAWPLQYVCVIIIVIFIPWPSQAPQGSCSQGALGAGGGGGGESWRGAVRAGGTQSPHTQPPRLEHRDAGYRKALPRSHLS